MKFDFFYYIDSITSTLNSLEPGNSNASVAKKVQSMFLHDVKC